jgi:hypothetical protein
LATQEVNLYLYVKNVPVVQDLTQKSLKPLFKRIKVLETNDVNFLKTFEKKFDQYKDLRIVLYGIGVKTISILENINFNFIGLMDKNPDSIGKTYFELKVLSPDEVIKSADIIIIVSADVYFQTIFSRIEFLQKEHSIPIFFCDGTEAKSYSKDNDIHENHYWQKD